MYARGAIRVISYVGPNGKLVKVPQKVPKMVWDSLPTD
jgi:hypothetical protein